MIESIVMTSKKDPDVVPTNSNDIERSIYRGIGNYFFHKNMEEDISSDLNKIVEKTYKEVKALSIHKVEIKDDTLWITTERPGIVIGVKGSVIDGISNYLKENENIIFNRIRIIEESNLPCLYDFTYVMGLDDDDYEY